MSKKKAVAIFLIFVISLAGFFYFRNVARKNTLPSRLSSQTYATGNGWGYRIFAADTMLLIQQDVIPGAAGSEAFKTEEKAAKTADFVISKIRKGIFPPTVSSHELDSLGVF